MLTKKIHAARRFPTPPLITFLMVRPQHLKVSHWLYSCDVNRNSKLFVRELFKTWLFETEKRLLIHDFFLRSRSMVLFKSVFIVSKSRSHVVNYSFKFILSCNYIYIFFSPWKQIAYRRLRGLGVAWKF